MERSAFSLFVLYQLVFIFFQLRNKKNLDSAKHCQDDLQSIKDYYLTPLLIVVAILFPLMPNLEIWVRAHTSPRTQTAGYVMLFGAAAIRGWASAVLGRNWSDQIDIYQNHQLVTTGPYRYVRHPIYASYLWWSIGAFLVNGSITILCLSILYPPLNTTRAEMEEFLLKQKFGKLYEAYVGRTGGIMPLNIERAAFASILTLAFAGFFVGGADELYFFATGRSFTIVPAAKLFNFLLQ